MLLTQALNHIQGDDDLGIKAELLRKVLDDVTREDVLTLLLETAESLDVLASLGQQDLAEHLQAWEKAQAARLRHMIFQLTPMQLEVVEEALEMTIAGATIEEENPNKRGNALYLVCRIYLESDGTYTPSRIRRKNRDE